MIADGAYWFHTAVLVVVVVAAFELAAFAVSELLERRRDRQRRWSRR